MNIPCLADTMGLETKVHISLSRLHLRSEMETRHSEAVVHRSPLACTRIANKMRKETPLVVPAEKQSFFPLEKKERVQSK